MPLPDLLESYYTQYYKNDCSIKSYEALVKARLLEEDLELKRIQDVQRQFGLNFQGQKHFIVGAGTGGLAVVLHREFGCDVLGVEPYAKGLEITHAKCEQAGINPKNFTGEAGENLSTPSGMFDFVHCYSVLEHVQDVDKTLDEMIRITKPGGKIYIHTPNYRFPFEGHYKIAFPTFLPRFLGKLYLKARGKSADFLDTINFLTISGMQKKLLKRKGISFTYLFRTTHRHNGRSKPFWDFLFYRLGIYPYQEILITKL